MADREELLALAERVERGKGGDNALDVKVEVALFEPSDADIAARANSAGTKVIYTAIGGGEETCWAPDWTLDRGATAALLRARALATQENNHAG